MSHSSESVIAADEVNKTLRHNESFLALAVVHLKINKPRCFFNKTYMFGRLCRYFNTSEQICQALFFNNLKYSILVYFKRRFRNLIWHFQ